MADLTQHPNRLTIEAQGADPLDVVELLYEVARDIESGRPTITSIGASPSRHFSVVWTTDSGSISSPSGGA